jgi:hypothetical protein
MRAAYARKHDDLIIMAATNPAKTGARDDMRDTILPASRIIQRGDPGLPQGAQGLVDYINWGRWGHWPQTP